MELTLSRNLAFDRIAGTRQLRIRSAESLLSIEILDEPHWMATSAPVHQLKCDPVLLERLDGNGDGRILSCELRESLRWLFSRLSNLAGVSKREDFLRLEYIDGESEQGRCLLESARVILEHLGTPDSDVLTLDQVRERKAVLAATDCNGDGVVPASTVTDPRLRSFIKDIVETVGGVPDIGGEVGVDETQLSLFIESAQALLDWRRSVSGSQSPPGSEMFPLGDATAEGYDLYCELAGPIDAYFTLCKVAELNESLGKEVPHSAVVEEPIEESDLALEYLRRAPLARPQPSTGLRLDHQVNPFYRDALHRLEKVVLSPLLGSSLEGDVLRESAWKTVKQAFKPYEAWLEEKPGGQVEKLGPETLKSYLRGDLCQRLRKRIAEDLAAGSELSALRDFEHLILLQRWALDLCNNFISFPDLYDPSKRAMFEVGRLILDGRVYNLNIPVEDVETHSQTARRSGIFLLYSEVTGDTPEETFFIVTPVTSGPSKNLAVGKRGVLFDLEGREWDTRVVKVVENLVSLRQAIAAPFRRVGAMVVSATEKIATGAEKQMESVVHQKAETLGQEIGKAPDFTERNLPTSARVEQSELKKGESRVSGTREMFLGMGVTVAALGSSFAFIAKTFSEMGVVSIVAALLTGLAVILVPTAIVAYFRLRARNLASILEASGWAINSPMRLTAKMCRVLSPKPVSPDGSTPSRTGRFGCLVWALMLLCMVQAGSQAAERPPNVVLIFADDQGSIDLNCYGATDLHTPNLDSLAQEGVRFTQFYVGAPVCSPSRASLLTGRYTIRAGVPGNVASRPGYEGMPTEQVTIAEMMKAAGYRTALFGKWHLGTIPECEPLAQGFDEFLGHRGGCIDNYSHFFYWAGPNRHDLQKGSEEYWEDGVHFSDIIVREAGRFLEENKNRPFFLYLPFNIPHYPLQAREEFREMYEEVEEPRKAYAALVSDFDRSVGKVLEQIDKHGLRENTLVICLSDHGHSTEERANFGGGNAGPYRGAKFSLFEGGIRVPCIARLPGTIPEGEVREQMGTSLDWFPTIADLCNVDLPDRKIDGKSLVPVLRSSDAESAHPTFHWQIQDQWAVRDGDWKIVVNPRDTDYSKLEGEDTVFLSNLASDVTERKNLAGEHPDIVKRLTKLHDEWAVEVESQ